MLSWLMLFHLNIDVSGIQNFKTLSFLLLRYLLNVWDSQLHWIKNLFASNSSCFLCTTTVDPWTAWFELWGSTYTWIFFSINTTVLCGPWLVEFEDVEVTVWESTDSGIHCSSWNQSPANADGRLSMSYSHECICKHFKIMFANSAFLKSPFPFLYSITQSK